MITTSRIREIELLARKAKVCPVSMLDEYSSNHWDFCALCAEFNCKECVATPEDFGYSNTNEQKESSVKVGAERSWAIPF